ncbi:MAG: heavy metal translocating P-type ATPase metal-binding domain-containing protein, partial [Pirellulales bacterium]|nr:heavy metal translocating P-type ATPase metal-binding domain-containing protein [Pirellulales bacterium]
MLTTSPDPQQCLLPVGCAHCGLPAPAPADASQPAFCCRGCRGAYELIRGWGLEEYYDLRDAPDSDNQVDVNNGITFADLDEPTLLGRSAPFPVQSQRDGRLFKATLSIAGLHCAACVWLVERASERVPGWYSSHVNMHARTVEVVFDPAVTRLSQIGELLFRLGYRVSAWREELQNQKDSDDSQRLMVDIAVAGFCAANAMWIAIALYAGQFSGMAAGHVTLLRVAGVVLGALAVIFPGRVFFRS